MLVEGASDIEGIDKAACDTAMPIGPLALRDMNGADIGLAVAKFNFQEYGERFAPRPILEKMVEKNLLSDRRLWADFYAYDKETRKRAGANPTTSEILNAVHKSEGKKSESQAKRLNSRRSACFFP